MPKAGEEMQYGNFLSIDTFEAKGQWTGGNISVSNDAREGKGSLRQDMQAAGDMVFCRNLKPIDLSAYSKDGYLHLWIYVDDASKISGGQIELTSSARSDLREINWNINGLGLKNGWNEIYVSVNRAEQEGGAPDFSKINYVRIYFHCKGKVTVGLDDLSFCRESATAAAGQEARLYFDSANNMALTFEVPGLSGLESSGVNLVDGKWHHILISRKGNAFRYHIDGKVVKTLNISGTPSYEGKDITIGNGLNQAHNFDGSLAELRIYNTAKTPNEVTDTVIDAYDNNDHKPRLKLEQGLVFDRRQYHAPRPFDYEGQTVTKDDIINAMNMGFDHVKLLLTPNHLIDKNGSLIVKNMEYITEVVQYVIDLDYVCYICIHPEDDFKVVYLGDLNNFELLLKWYGELSAYIGARWDADHVGLQLMTEPYNNSSLVSWSWMSDRMWGVVRNVLPYHTIITSSDRLGNIE